MSAALRLTRSEEPTNASRAARIDAAMVAWRAARGEKPDEGDALDFMVDLRHWCDANGRDYYQLCDRSYIHYVDECAEERATARASVQAAQIQQRNAAAHPGRQWRTRRKQGEPVQPVTHCARVDAYALKDIYEFMHHLRRLLRARTGRVWSVSKGRGTVSQWVTIGAPPKRCTFGHDGTGEGSYMGAEDRALLARALQKESIHSDGESVPASTAHRQEYLDRAAGINYTPAPQYWD